MIEQKFYRRAQAKWDAWHMKTASCRLIKQDYMLFRVLCKACNTTVHRLLRAFIAAMLKEFYPAGMLTPGIQRADRLIVWVLDDIHKGRAMERVKQTLQGAGKERKAMEKDIEEAGSGRKEGESGAKLSPEAKKIITDILRGEYNGRGSNPSFE